MAKMKSKKQAVVFQLDFDPDDLDQIQWLVENADRFDTKFAGENEDGEMAIIEVTGSYVLVKTFQSNNWIRRNYYYPDGYREELFDRQ